MLRIAALPCHGHKIFDLSAPVFLRNLILIPQADSAPSLKGIDAYCPIAV